MIRTFFILVISTVLGACGVPKKEYTALKDQVAGCETSRSACAEKLASLSSTKEQLSQELEQKTKTYEDLVGSLQNEIKDGKIKISEMKDRLTVNLIDKILFDSGSITIKDEGKDALGKIAAILKGVEGKRIEVDGHTDDVKLGPTLAKRFPSNWELSTARATSVVKHLVDEGVQEKRLSAAGFSMFNPVAPNETPEGRQQNRRIEIVLLPELPVQPAAVPTPSPAENPPAP